MLRLIAVGGIVLGILTSLLISAVLMLGSRFEDAPQLAFVAIIDERLTSRVYTYDVMRDLHVMLPVQVEGDLQIGADPYWVADGEKVLLGLLGDEVNTLDVPGGRLTPVTDLTSTAQGGITEIAVSADGRWLAYVLLAGDVGDVYIVSLADKRIIQATDAPPQFTYERLEWLPDSSSLVFTGRRLMAGINPALYQFDLTGERLQMIADDLRHRSQVKDRKPLSSPQEQSLYWMVVSV